jgi:hypothetical protein
MGVKGDMGEQGPPGEKLLESVKYPLVLDKKTNTVTFDTKSLEKVLQSLTNISKKSEADFDYAGITDWLAAAGGAVGIRDDGTLTHNSVDDINFKGDGVIITKQGKSVDVEISGVGTVDGGTF